MKKAKIFFLLIMFTLFSSDSNGSYKKLAYDFSFNDLDVTEIKLSEI